LREARSVATIEGVPEPVLEREDVNAALTGLLDIRSLLDEIRILLEEALYGGEQEEES
jgi:hypothetical protein